MYKLMDMHQERRSAVEKINLVKIIQKASKKDSAADYFM
jgi:hypothetical protein